MARTIPSCLGLGLVAVAAIGATAGLAAIPGAAVLAAAAGSAVDGLAGNYLTKVCEVLHRPVAERWLAGRPGIAENHRVASALRLAQLKALGLVRDRFDTTWFASRAPERQASSAFSYALKDFLETETQIADRAGFDADRDLAPNDAALRGAVLKELPDVFDASLAARRAPDTQATLLADLRRAVEAAVLAEISLRTATPQPGLPDAFLNAFAGDGFPEPWFDLFVRDAASRLAEIPDFAVIWQAEQDALAKAIGAATLAAVQAGFKDVQATQAQHSAEHAEQLALLKKIDAATGALVDALGENKALSKQLEAASVDKAKVLALARRTAENVYDFDQALAELEYRVGVAIEVSREGQGGDNLGAFVDAVLTRVRRRYDANDFDAAAAEATSGFEEWRRRETERRAEAAQAGLKILNAGLQQDILRRDPAAAAERIELVAGIQAEDGSASLLDALRTHFEEWDDRGRDKGLNFDMEIAIAIARRALKHTQTADERSAWHNLLGNALQTLGERESGTARLEEAVRAYRGALEEYKQDRVPLDWAATQNNLGVALQTLGEREGGTARLEEAVRAYRAALEERTQDRVPLDWAGTRNNLGIALWTLGAREGGTARLAEAVRAYRAVLEEFTQDRVPLDWAATQNNLGAALQTLGEREGGTARLAEAVRAYRAALEERTQDRVPLDWAGTQNNLGNALSMLGEREGGTARLAEAVRAYRAALEERTQDRVPLNWAMSLGNQGVALCTLPTAATMPPWPRRRSARSRRPGTRAATADTR